MKKFFTLMMAMSCTIILTAAKVNKFFNINVNGKNRTYLLYVPNNVKASAPLVISMHGAGGQVTTTSHDPDFNSIAEFTNSRFLFSSIFNTILTIGLYIVLYFKLKTQKY